MSDPIKAAAERARQRRAGEHLATDEDWHDPTSPDVDDTVLADAYLAANLADDDEPIDETWLLSLGGERNPANNSIELGRLSYFIKGDGGYWLFGDEDIPAILTRGYFRRLCRLIGISLKEPTP